ncbi:LytTR family transcriptional regulator DNA-binding domain-containing protein [Pedobacter sandarakinus]|uniref:LytTR family transcriptional regulator DNA-binding domain-containing protein n=1 Tax=Pedobacter sandarakinus TaxID=353156 RepID=UPI0022453529|nr:LytTR family transcriptional regulator DNA-binding domain-containing protein [Pedobacter sandarakinus]MCX2574003.1 LytTR family transcriptional regulator DNA-binding domain-containing protein [Pedobacter sandarakinus]
MDSARYPNIYVRVLVSLFIGHFLVSYGEDQSLFQLLFISYYYPALGGSFIITMILGEFIYKLHHYFEDHHTWRANAKVRLLLQLVCGIVMSTVLAVSLAYTYFRLRNVSIIDAGYFRYDFTLVLSFIALGNCYYAIISLLRLKLLPTRRNHSNTTRSSEASAKLNHPAIIFSKDRNVYVYQFDGRKLIWDKTLKETREVLTSGKYFQINRAAIIHYQVVSHYRPGESNTLKLFFRKPFEDLRYHVSQRNTVAFKRWFASEGLE